MLTWQELEVFVASGCLVVWNPLRTDIPPDGRVLYLTEDVFDALQQRPWPATAPGERREVTRDRRAAMREVLRRYVIGGRLNLERDIAELGSKINRPEHRGFWEFRSQGPRVETRLFGFFARAGAFVGVGFEARADLNFRAAFASGRREWSNLFGNRPFLNSPYPVSKPVELDSYLTRSDDA